MTFFNILSNGMASIKYEGETADELRAKIAKKENVNVDDVKNVSDDLINKLKKDDVVPMSNR